MHADEERAARREAAIVTHVPGTTRDILEISLDIGGLPVVVADTAGLRETADEVEQIGIERARKAWVPSAPSHLIFDKVLIITRHSCCACPCLCACVRAMFVSWSPQSSSRRRIASRTRVPRRGLLRNALGPTARRSCGARSARDTKHVHPAQQDGFAPDIRASANDGAYQSASATTGACLGG